MRLLKLMLLVFCLITFSARIAVSQIAKCKLCSAGEVTVDTDGAYQGILVVIDKAVQYDPTIISNIQV